MNHNQRIWCTGTQKKRWAFYCRKKFSISVAHLLCLSVHNWKARNHFSFFAGRKLTLHRYCVVLDPVDVVNSQFLFWGFTIQTQLEATLEVRKKVYILPSSKKYEFFLNLWKCPCEWSPTCASVDSIGSWLSRHANVDIHAYICA